VLLLAEDQSGYVASILSRRARLLGLMWDLDNTPLVKTLLSNTRRRYWFTKMRPAPWIDGHVISEGRKLAGVSLVTVPGVPVPLGHDVYVPAQRHSDVPPEVPPPDTPARPLAIAGPERRAGRHRAPDRGGEQPVTSTGTTGRHRAAIAADTVADSGEEELIVGISAAARYLGYSKPDSFRRARTRHPIPGEGKAGDGRPCWIPKALPSWQSKRKIAGNRTHVGGPD
jgi:hypothetical protein